MDTLAHPITNSAITAANSNTNVPENHFQHLLIEGDDCYPALAPKIFGIIFRKAIDQKLQFGRR